MLCFTPTLAGLWDLFGAFHPATVHIPIGLLVMAALMIVARATCCKTISPDVAYYCLVVGAAGSVGATLMGWSFAVYQGYGDMWKGPDAEVFWHRWTGVIVTVIAVKMAVFATIARRKPESIFSKLWPTGTLICAALVGWVGHQGGEMTYGEDLYCKAWGDCGETADDHDGKKAQTPQPAPPPADGKVDFVLHIKPVFEKYCVHCHGEKKDKANFRMHTKKHAFESGDSTPYNIIAGKSGESFLIELMEMEADSDELMPPKKEGGPLSKETIVLIRRWIDEGAHWPDGVVLQEKKK